LVKAIKGIADPLLKESSFAEPFSFPKYDKIAEVSKIFFIVSLFCFQKLVLTFLPQIDPSL